MVVGNRMHNVEVSLSKIACRSVDHLKVQKGKTKQCLLEARRKNNNNNKNTVIIITMAISYPETGFWLNTPLQYITNEMERCRDTAKDTGQSNSHL